MTPASRLLHEIHEFFGIFKPALHGSAQADAVKKEWFRKSPFVGDVAGAMHASHEAQDQLAKAAAEITRHMPGVTFVNPGVKTNHARIVQKMKERGDISRVTDLARGSFLVDDPRKSQQLADRLSRHLEVAEEDWRTTAAGYGDKALQVHFPNGLVGEVQVMHPEMFKAKMGEGHKLYEHWRSTKNAAHRQALTQRMKDLYSKVTDHYSPAWRSAFGIGTGPNLAANVS